MCPARCSPSTQAEYARCAASRSPRPQNASPDRADAPARVTWSSSAARSIASWACRRVAGASPRDQRQRGPIHLDRPGQAGELRLVDDDHPRRRRSGDPARSWVAGSSHRSTSRRRSSTPSNSLPAINAPTRPTASTGLIRTTSSGMTSSQPRIVASCLFRCSAGMASSTRSAARSMSPAASAWRTAGDGCPCWSYHRLARRCRSATSSGRSSSRCACNIVREKVVVAVPVPAVVERDQEQVGAVQRLQGGLAAGLTGHGIAQRAAQPVEQAGPQQEGRGPVRSAAAEPPRPGSPRCTGRRPRTRR